MTYKKAVLNTVKYVCAARDLIIYKETSYTLEHDVISQEVVFTIHKVNKLTQHNSFHVI